MKCSLIVVLSIALLPALTAPSAATDQGIRERFAAAMPRTELPKMSPIIKVDSWGSCGQFCRRTNGQTWDCPRSQRPRYMNNGDCVCESDRACN